MLKQGEQIVLVGIGKLARRALEAARLLETEGIFPEVIDPRVISPVRKELLEDLAGFRLVMTAEDGITKGGAGEHLASLTKKMAEEKGQKPPFFVNLGIPIAHLPHGSPDEILSSLGLDAPGIAASVLEAASWLEVGGAQSVAPSGRGSAS